MTNRAGIGSVQEITSHRVRPRVPRRAGRAARGQGGVELVDAHRERIRPGFRPTGPHPYDVSIWEAYGAFPARRRRLSPASRHVTRTHLWRRTALEPSP